jgi:N-terminal half of MaoC dehydratase
VSWRFLAPVRPGDEITAQATVTAVREDKPVSSLATTVTNQDGVVVLDGTAVVWRDPTVEAAEATRKWPRRHLPGHSTVQPSRQLLGPVPFMTESGQ